MSNEKNEIMATEASTYLTDPVNLNELFSEELDGLRPSFERIKIPAGGGISYEVPGDDPDSPDTVKEYRRHSSPPSRQFLFQGQIQRSQQSSRLRQHRWQGWCSP